MAQEFEFRLVLTTDKIGINVTQQSVEFRKLSEDAILRPRHIQLTDEIIRIIKEKGK